MADAFEFLVGIFARLVYGPVGHPRHVIWRSILRTVAFGGSLITIGNLLGIAGNLNVPLWLTVVWLFCFTTVIAAEYFVGNPLLSLLSVAIGVCLLGWAIF